YAALRPYRPPRCDARGRRPRDFRRRRIHHDDSSRSCVAALFLYHCALVKNDDPAGGCPPPDRCPPCAALALQQRVSQPIQIARHLATVERAGPPVVVIDRALLARLEGLEHILPAVPPAGCADLPEVGRDHDFDGSARADEFGAVKDRLTALELFQHGTV